jgi:hypothetical protein
MAKDSSLDKRSQKDLVWDKPLVAFIYVAIGKHPEENAHLIKIGKTRNSIRNRLSLFYLAFDFKLTELANIKGFNTILKRREKALELVKKRKNHKRGVPITFEYNEAKIQVKLNDKNLISIAEELAKHIAKREGLTPIMNTSGEVFEASPSLEKTFRIRNKIVSDFRTALAWYYEDVVLEGGELSASSITDFYDKLISDDKM